MRVWIRTPQRIQFIHTRHSLLRLLLASPVCSEIFHSQEKNWEQLREEAGEFLPWLRRRTGLEISSVLSVGFSNHGRSLFASRSIKAGDCVLKVPYSAQLTTGKIIPEIDKLLVDDVDNISRLAVVLLAEKKLGQDSEWAPYLDSLPSIKEMNNMIFWSKEELDMVRACTIYQDTMDQKAHLEEEFLALKPALERFPQLFGDVMLEDFMHAYAQIISRAWRTSKGISLISLIMMEAQRPCCLVMMSRKLQRSLLIGVIRSGNRFLLGMGSFLMLRSCWILALLFNIISMIRYRFGWMFQSMTPCIHSSQIFFTNIIFQPKMFQNLQGIALLLGKGKGIPQALRAYARVLSIRTHEELEALQMEAMENDGRLARRPFKDTETEIRAHRILLSEFTNMFQGCDSSVKVLESINSHGISSQLNTRRKMAIDLLHGELRVLKSGCSWLSNYCKNVSFLSGQQNSVT